MAGATRRGGLEGSLALSWWASACAAPPGDAEDRLARLQAEEERLDAALNAVEARLLNNQARLHLWKEWERRHGEVSALQCRVTEVHLAGIARHQEHQAQKERERARRRSLSAVDTPVLTSARPEEGPGVAPQRPAEPGPRDEARESG